MERKTEQEEGGRKEGRKKGGREGRTRRKQFERGWPRGVAPGGSPLQRWPSALLTHQLGFARAPRMALFLRVDSC